jgi:uncharacterized protein with PQ loop repeat
MRVDETLGLKVAVMDQLCQQRQSLRRKELRSTDTRPGRLVLGIDALAYIVSVLSLLFTADQVRIIWVDHDAGGVSFLSWTFYTISAFVWFVYGILHKDKVLMITNFLWAAFALAIVIGVVVYK